NEKSVEGDLYLHEKLPQFNVANAYQYNDLVRSGSNIAYECLTKVNANTGNLNNGAQFRKLTKISYATPRTNLLFAGMEKTVKLKVPAPTVQIKYFEFNPVSELYDKEKKLTIIGPEQNPKGEDVSSVVLNFTDATGQEFPEGIYKVTINAQEECIYFRSKRDWQPYIGLINIHNSELVPASYQYLKPDGTFFMQPPANTEVATKNYFIRFAPAQYLLKYVCKTNKVLDIIDENGKIEFDNLGGNVFRSKLPVRMNEKAIETISVQYDGADVIKKTKNPGYRDLSILDGDNRYLVSETYLNL
ncbi:MAG: hypothetical protein KDD32_06715, partial [Bacteroidetes bacterium]|nr:hypothetical protein [Bacteroidota bacterium]